MSLFGVWIPGDAVFWGALVLIVFFSSYFRYLTRASRHRMIERLTEKGQNVTPELLDRIDSGKHD
jgi:hypothetical protein